MCTCEQHTYTSSEHFHLEELRRNHARPGQRKFSCPGRESNSRPSKSHHSRETNRKIMAGILSYEPAFDRKIVENFGYVSSVQEAYKLIPEFETGSTIKFSCCKVDKDFGNIGVYLRFIYYCAFHKHANSEFKSQLTIAFFAAVNYLNGPLSKQRALSIYSKFPEFPVRR